MGKNLGKVYSTSKNIRKISRFLPKSWEAKVMLFKKQDLTKLPWDEFVGYLTTHEGAHGRGIQKEEKYSPKVH